MYTYSVHVSMFSMNNGSYDVTRKKYGYGEAREKIGLIGSLCCQPLICINKHEHEDSVMAKMADQF